MSGFHRVMRVLALFVTAALLTIPARAHEMSIAEMEVRETSPGEFSWHWSVPLDEHPELEYLAVQWPGDCTAGRNTLHCGSKRLEGTLAIDGVGDRYSAAMVKVVWLDGTSRVYTLTPSQSSVELYGSAVDDRGKGEIARAYTVLGVEHILGGIDHLLFVAGLLFLVGFRRRLIGTITAFTLAHSITLALSVLDWVTLRPAPVEGAIALSIVLVAGEALRERKTLARRMPELVSFSFGLVHGLGFAGALKEMGLPESHRPLALLTFNLGVELGQLMMVLLALVVWRLPVVRKKLGPARRPALYAVGTVAAYWSWLRIAAIFL